VSDEQIALALPPVNEAWNRFSACDDRSMTPGRLKEDFSGAEDGIAFSGL
jgi:hypothetical protein